MVPWTQLREPPLWGKCLTDLTSEFTHFNLVIRLSKVKQPAMGFSAFSWVPLFLPSLRPQWSALSSAAVQNYLKPPFSQQLLCYRLHVMTRWTGRHTTCRCGLFLLMVVWWGETYCASNSLELVQLFMPLWHDLTTGLKWHNARLLGLGTESWFCSVFHQLVPHWSPISFSPPPPGRLAPSRSEVFVGSRCVRLVQALPSSPPSAGLGPCPSTLRSFFFFLAFSGFARSGLGVLVCVYSLLLLLRSPLRVLVKYFSSHLHSHLIGHPPFILIFISLFTRTTLPEAGCVCVYRLKRRKTSSYYIILYYILLGITGVPGGSVINEDTPPGPV